MDRINRERFGRLRHHLAKPQRDAIWRNALCFMLLRAAREHPEMYQGMWVPYLSGLRGMWQTPLRVLGSMSDVRTWSELAPFALFDLYMANGVGRESIHQLCVWPVALRVGTLHLEHNMLRRKEMRQLASTPFAHIDRLVLSHNSLSPIDVERVLMSTSFDSLREIQLDTSLFSLKKKRDAFEQEFSRGGALRFDWF